MSLFKVILVSFQSKHFTDATQSTRPAAFRDDTEIGKKLVKETKAQMSGRSLPDLPQGMRH
jgi:hypothetical protein